MISALFVRSDSIYKTMGIDCWDINRNASLWPGGNSIIAHPPCRAWGKFERCANPLPGEKELAVLSIKWIRKYGGVLEHPSSSKLWKVIPLPYPGSIDEFGGFSICINQSDFGHKAQKKTLLYIKGCSYSYLPPLPILFNPPTHVIAGDGRSRKKSKNYLQNQRPEVTKKEREATPLALALWLIEVAEKCQQNNLCQ